MKNYNNELLVALKAIKKASKIVMDYYHGDFIINYKQDNSEVTSADIASQEIINNILKENFKDYPILGEENKDDLSRINSDYCWIVDPLDGTKDFVNKTDNFAINIALSYKHEIVLGIISVPCKNIIYYATINNGAYKIENDIVSKITVSNRKDNLIMLTSKFFSKGNEIYNNNSLIKQIIFIGSSYKAGLIAEGKADLCIKQEPYTKEWDTACSEIIIKEANGIISDKYGNHMLYNKEDVYNHNGFIIANSKTILNIFKFKDN